LRVQWGLLQCKLKHIKEWAGALGMRGMKWFGAEWVRGLMALVLLAIGVTQVVWLWQVPLSGMSFGRAMLGFTNILVSLGLQGTSRLPYLIGSMTLSVTVMVDAEWLRSGETLAALSLGVVLISLVVLLGLGGSESLRELADRREAAKAKEER